MSEGKRRKETMRDVHIQAAMGWLFVAADALRAIDDKESQEKAHRAIRYLGRLARRAPRGRRA